MLQKYIPLVLMDFHRILRSHPILSKSTISTFVFWSTAKPTPRPVLLAGPPPDLTNIFILVTAYYTIVQNYHYEWKFPVSSVYPTAALQIPRELCIKRSASGKKITHLPKIRLHRRFAYPLNGLLAVIYRAPADNGLLIIY